MNERIFLYVCTNIPPRNMELLGKSMHMCSIPSAVGVFHRFVLVVV